MPEKSLQDGERIVAEKGMAFTGVEAAPGNSQRLAREFLDSLLLEMRVVDATEASTRTSFFGADFATPVMVTALSALDRVHPDGMRETARGAAAAGAAMWVGIGDDDELARIVDTGVKAVKIIKPYRDHDLIMRKIEHARICGALAVGMDVSYSFGMKNGWSPAPMSPKSVNDLGRFAAASKLPFVLKGILSTRDAAKALEANAAGIMVSHQGGTVLDYAVPPVKILPDIGKSLSSAIPVFVDCAIQSGTDVFKALAFGATGVGVGKKIMSGLAAGGAEGVTRVIEDMTKELARVMPLTGSATVGTIDKSVIRPQ